MQDRHSLMDPYHPRRTASCDMAEARPIRFLLSAQDELAAGAASGAAGAVRGHRRRLVRPLLHAEAGAGKGALPLSCFQAADALLLATLFRKQSNMHLCLLARYLH